jgi:hypothetical protein
MKPRCDILAGKYRRWRVSKIGRIAATLYPPRAPSFSAQFQVGKIPSLDTLLPSVFSAKVYRWFDRLVSSIIATNDPAHSGH